jgi:hypothetical protein
VWTQLIVEKLRKSRLAWDLLEWQRDQIAEAALRHRVLIWEKIDRRNPAPVGDAAPSFASGEACLVVVPPRRGQAVEKEPDVRTVART